MINLLIIAALTIPNVPTLNLEAMHGGMGCLTDTECETGIEDTTIDLNDISADERSKITDER